MYRKGKWSKKCEKVNWFELYQHNMLQLTSVGEAADIYL